MQMETQERRLQLLENFIYLVIWVVVLVMPLWDIDKLENSSEIDWESVFHAWKMICPLLILFLVNNYILLPFLLIRKKSWLYLLFTICAVGLTIIVSIRNMNGQEMHGRDMHGNRPPWENRDREQVRGERPPMIPERMQRPDPGGFRLPPFIAPHFLIAILIIGVNMAIKFLFKSIRDDHRMKSLEKQTSEAELAYLKHQINPHFFMNTLNNIHALIDIDTESAKNAVIELSKMMRYVLYDSGREIISLNRDIQFLKNYIELMRIRYTDAVNISVESPGNLPEQLSIPPLLLIVFVENAFKHGISYSRPSFIHIRVRYIDGKVYYSIINSRHTAEPSGKDAGIGLENVRRRLQLIFANRHTLAIDTRRPNMYRVKLIIPATSHD